MALNVQPLSPMRRMAMALVMALLLAASLGFAQLLIQRGGHQATMVVLKRVHFLPPPGEKEIVVNTAGDLEKGTVHDLPIKVGDAMRKVHAYDRDTGKELWMHSVPNGAEGMPATYQVNGRQFVVLPVAQPNATFPATFNNAGGGREGRGGGGTALPGAYIAFALPQ